MKTVLVHGFLGLPEEWQSFTADQKVNLWGEISPLKYASLDLAGERLAEVVNGDQLTLVGYSLGGRIVLHWPKDQWSRIHRMILISAHGGFSTSSEKQMRLQSDTKWSERFLKEEWAKLMQSWNAQSVFKSDSVRPFRLERDYNREALASALTHWSLGQQEEQTEKLKKAPFPITYVYGLHDSKFANYAKSLQKKRLPWTFTPLDGGHSVHLSHSPEIMEMMHGASLSNPLIER